MFPLNALRRLSQLFFFLIFHCLTCVVDRWLLLTQMRFGTAAPKPKRQNSEALSTKASTAVQHAADRKLVEDYWRSVIESKGEPPLYHTFSDRYGGTKGIPFAARTDCSSVCKAAGHSPNRDVNKCIGSAVAALKHKKLEEAHAFFLEAMTLLQNFHGGLSITELVQRNKSHEVSLQLSEVLRGLAEVCIMYRQYDNAVELLDLCSLANPLNSETYVFRASCYERLGRPKEAYEEFEKYLKLNAPSLDVLAHCGKCAAEAGLISEAEDRLRQLLEVAEHLAAEEAEGWDLSSSTTVASYLFLFEKASLYVAHANFYLGYIREMQAHGLPSEFTVRALLLGAKPYFAKAVSNVDYVAYYERNVCLAMEHEEYPVAKELLLNLQMMKPDCAAYFTRMAEVCRMMKDLSGEISALSEALDRHQSLSQQRQTRLARGSIFYEIQDYNRAIQDFTIAISMPSDDLKDHFTPIAFFKRAETYQQRQSIAKNAAQSREDQEAALSDYSHFLEAIRSLGPVPKGDGAQIPQAEIRGFACESSSVTSAMLVLANGAFQRGNYSEATRFFSSAIARGWEPIQPSAKRTEPAVPAASSDSINKRLLDNLLFDQMYISLAHTVIEEHPISNDMFKIPYESREWVVQQDLKKGKAAERKDQEPMFAFPSLSYSTVDCRYNALRQLEPTMYSALEEMFLELWEPYHNEVDRTREDVMSARGKRGKRHGA